MNIGEVSATLKANVGQYVAAMLQAGKSTAEIQQSVENTAKALLAEGAAGQAAGKGLASFGASAEELKQQLAAAEGRLSQLSAAFAAMGIPAAGKDFREVTDEVNRLRAALAAAGGVVPDLGPKLEVPLKRVPPVANAATKRLSQLRGSLTALASTAVGIPGPLGNLASKLLMFGAGGGVTVAVAAGLAVLATAFTKLREKAVAESKATEDAVNGLVQRYQEATGAIARRNKERAEAELADIERRIAALTERAQRQPAQRSLVGGVGERTADALQEATDRATELRNAIRQANDELEAFNKPKAEAREGLAGAQAALALARTTDELTRAQLAYQQAARGVRAANEAVEASAQPTTEQVQAQADATDRLRNASRQLEAVRRTVLVAEGREYASLLNINTGLDGLLTSQLNTIQKQLMEVRAQKQAWSEVEAVQEAIREAEMEKALQGTKGDSRLKDAVENQRQEAVDAMRGVADAMARGFMDAFSDNQKNLADKIASALLRAAQDAIAQLLASKIFGGLLDALFGGGGKGKGGLGGLIEDIPVIGNILSAPALPAAALAPAMGGSVTIDLSSIPRAMSPIEYARDDMWRSIWVETARQAAMNGVNLQPRF